MQGTISKTGPAEADGKPIVVHTPSSQGLMTWIVSRGDETSPASGSGRGTGDRMRVNITEPGTVTSNWKFIEPIEVHDGEVSWNPSVGWTHDDEFSIGMDIPATSVTSKPSGDGNCNVVNSLGQLGEPDSVVIVPAYGTPESPGFSQVDLTTAVPVPASKTPDKEPDGFWDMDWYGNLMASKKAGAAEWHLLTIPQTSYLIKNVSMGNSRGVFSIDVYQAEWCSPLWTFRLDVTRVGDVTGTIQVGGWMMMFRESAT